MATVDLSDLCWHKSSRSTNYGNCVEVAFAGWRKSSRSSSQPNCVEVAAGDGAVAVRDSKDPGGGALVVAGDRWAAFLGGLRQRRYDR